MIHMDVTGFLNSRQHSLFEKDVRHGTLKRAVARMLHTANAGVRGPLYFYRDEFYGLKSRILEKYGVKDGIDWQEITRTCNGCDDCGGRGRWDGWTCGGTRVYSRKFVPLTRRRLGGFVFHTPGLSVPVLPAGEQVKFNGIVPHASVRAEDAQMAFVRLCALFDDKLFERIAGRLNRVDVPF